MNINDFISPARDFRLLRFRLDGDLAAAKWTGL